MLFCDLGADVIRIDRVGQRSAFEDAPECDVLARGRRSVALDLKDPRGLTVLLALVEKADGLWEGYRPGVAERLGFGPEPCLRRNPRLVYGRMTGYGQEGPLSGAAGHDINYISLAGALQTIGRSGERPVPPLNLVGDFGGGGMLLAFGMVCALFEASRSGQGQVVDAAMIDGTTALMAMVWGARAQGMWTDERGANVLDTGAHFYDVYETSDGRFVSVGAMEPQFYAEFVERLGLTDDPDFSPQRDRTKWPVAKKRLEEIFRSRTMDEWCAQFEGADACFTPVLGMAEVADHPHHVSRETFVEPGGIRQGNVAPRFSRTPGRVGTPPARNGEHTDEVLAAYGFSADSIAEMRSARIVA